MPERIISKQLKGKLKLPNVYFNSQYGSFSVPDGSSISLKRCNMKPRNNEKIAKKLAQHPTSHTVVGCKQPQTRVLNGGKPVAEMKKRKIDRITSGNLGN